MTEIDEDLIEQDLARRLEQLIFDRLAQAYDQPAARRLARVGELVTLHGRMWQSLIRGDDVHGARLRQWLLQLVAQISVPVRIVWQADKTVLEELFAVVSERFRHSPQRLQAYCQSFERAARCLHDCESSPPPSSKRRPKPATPSLHANRLGSGGYAVQLLL
ncbi:MAG: hypothetical protein JO273_26015 [Methylobacteriaceae bacterium]|nr:hypothetical protein [Methylobacteriaceae bacterium]